MGDFSSVPLDDDPFNLSPLNEEEGLHSVTRSLEMARGFSLLIARCNLPPRTRPPDSSRQIPPAEVHD